MARKDANPGAKEAAATRRAAVMKYRIAGLPEREIAARVGASPSTVHADIKAALKEVNEKTFADTKALQALQWERLEMVLPALAVKAMKGDVAAVDRWVAVIKAQCELKGLNDPKRVAPLLGGLAGDADESDGDETRLAIEERVERVLVILETGRARRGSSSSGGD